MNHQHPQPQPLAQVGTAYDLQRIAEAASCKQRDEGLQIAAAPQSPVEAAFSQMDETLSALRSVVQRGAASDGSAGLGAVPHRQRGQRHLRRSASEHHCTAGRSHGAAQCSDQWACCRSGRTGAAPGAVMGMAEADRHQLAPTPVRLPPAIKDRLQALAKGAGRSLNAEIVHRLAQTLGEDFAAEQPAAQLAAQPVLAEMLAQMRKQTDCLRELVELARAANPE